MSEIDVRNMPASTFIRLLKPDTMYHFTLTAPLNGETITLSINASVSDLVIALIEYFEKLGGKITITLPEQSHQQPTIDIKVIPSTKQANTEKIEDTDNIMEEVKKMERTEKMTDAIENTENADTVNTVEVPTIVVGDIGKDEIVEIINENLPDAEEELSETQDEETKQLEIAEDVNSVEKEVGTGQIGDEELSDEDLDLILEELTDWSNIPDGNYVLTENGLIPEEEKEEVYHKDMHITPTPIVDEETDVKSEDTEKIEINDVVVLEDTVSDPIIITEEKPLTEEDFTEENFSEIAPSKEEDISSENTEDIFTEEDFSVTITEADVNSTVLTDEPIDAKVIDELFEDDEDDEENGEKQGAKEETQSVNNNKFDIEDLFADDDDDW